MGRFNPLCQARNLSLDMGDGHGMNGWDGDGWRMDGGWMIWFRDFSNSDLLGNVGREEIWMDLDVFAGDVVAGDE